MSNQCKRVLSPLSVCLLLALTGCARTEVKETTPVIAPVATQVAKQANFVETLNASPVNNDWLNAFSDDHLDALVAEAMKNNPDLKSAYFGVVGATTNIQLSKSAMLPTVGWAAGTSTEVGDTSDVSALTKASQNADSAGFGVGWEADLWGRMSAGVSATQASVRSAVADYSYARQSLAAAVASGWFQYVTASKQLALSKSILANYQDIYKLVEKRYQVGKVTQKDVVQAKAQINQAKDAIVQAELGVKTVARGLESLLGRYPSAEIASSDLLPKLPAFPATGVPIDVLKRRPDVIAAEEQLRAAFYVDGQAKLARYPSLSFSYNPATTNTANFLSTLAANIAGPLYMGGAIDAKIKAADASQKMALYHYQSVVLKAFKEVEQKITNEKSYVHRETLLSAIVKDNNKALGLTKTQYEVGRIDLGLLLSQEATYEASRVTYLGMQNAMLSNRVQMYLALGGSFDKSAANLAIDQFKMPDEKQSAVSAIDK